MGRSVVLKDLSNHPVGYVLISGAEVVCRVSLEEKAKLIILFLDGSDMTYTLDKGTQEQRFACSEKAMRGCCIFRGTELLYISDEAVRSICTMRIRPERSCENERGICKQEHTSSKAQTAREDATYEFMQRRWPPPPCWPAAYYMQGQWKEKSRE